MGEEMEEGWLGGVGEEVLRGGGREEERGSAYFSMWPPESNTAFIWERREGSSVWGV